LCKYMFWKVGMSEVQGVFKKKIINEFALPQNGRVSVSDMCH